MALRLRKPPIIVLGAPRSGTSMLTRMLEALGVFVGWRTDSNHESRFFLRINEWLLSQSGGSWSEPSPIHYLLQNPELRSRTTNYIASRLLESPRAISYLGMAKYLHYRSIYRLEKPWGWKDPRNTFTLPIWLDLFPGAKIIYIQRRGDDVAASLRRFVRMVHWRSKLYESLGPLQWIRPKSGPFRHPRCDQTEGCYSLWQEYVSHTAITLSSLRERPLKLQYESIQVDPLSCATELARFCELEVTIKRIQSVAAMVNGPVCPEIDGSDTIVLPTAMAPAAESETWPSRNLRDAIRLRDLVSDPPKRE